jgi:CP family cyanate transporter-like MFS transporter
VLLFISMVARTFVSDVTLLLLTTVGVGAGIAIAGTLFAGIIKAGFPTKVAIMMSIYTTALAGSTTISAAATGPIAAFAVAKGLNGWRIGTGIWSPVALIAIFAALGILMWERRELARATAKTVTAVRLPLRNSTAWLVALFFACDNFLFFAFLAWTSPIYREHGLSTASADLVLATFTVVFTVAMPMLGLLSRAHDRRGWLAVCAVLSGIGILGMALVPSPIPHIWVAIAAFGVGGGFTLGMTLPLDNAHSADEANAWNAFMMTVGYLLAATGPLLVGLLRDVTGTFQAPIWLLFMAALGMFVLTPFLAPRSRSTVLISADHRTSG